MAISIEDMKNISFKIEKRGGYNCDEVDDFMDELAGQTEDLANENIRLQAEVNAAKKAVAEANAKAAQAMKELEAVKAEAEKKETAPAVQEAAPVATYNEPSYFKNLETTLRETLISAQRIADETVDAAQKKAKEIISEAEAKAAAIDEESQKKLADMTAEYDKVKEAGSKYAADFAQLIAQQNELLKNSPLCAE